MCIIIPLITVPCFCKNDEICYPIMVIIYPYKK
nr:MAG TPA: hypothetical protein [Caudoviricetes sp.]